jgi:hypothetical protein
MVAAKRACPTLKVRIALVSVIRTNDDKQRNQSYANSFITLVAYIVVLERIAILSRICSPVTSQLEHDAPVMHEVRQRQKNGALIARRFARSRGNR